MKIAFVNISDITDIRRGSGTPYHIWQELIRQGHTVHLVCPLTVAPPLLTRLFKWLSIRMGKEYRSHRDPFMGQALGRAASLALKDVDADLILTNDFCLAGYIRAKQPIVLYTDAHFPYRYAENQHPWLADLSVPAIFFSQYTTARGLKQAALCAFASQFAADEARKYPQTKNKLLHVIPYGANIEPPENPPERSVEKIKQKGCVDVLFIGKDWALKGGDVAVKVIQQLNQRGVKTRLHIVGVDLSAQYPYEYLTFYGLLNKDNEAERAVLEELFQTCDILLVPSKAEGYGLVFVEAAAYGMPSLAYANSGVTTAIGENSGGVLFELSKDEAAFADKIEDWLQSPGEYEKQSQLAGKTYLEEKNWRIAVAHLINLIKSTVKEKENVRAH